MTRSRRLLALALFTAAPVLGSFAIAAPAHATCSNDDLGHGVTDLGPNGGSPQPLPGGLSACLPNV